MINCVVSHDHLEKCIDIIKDNASENKVGDGKIFIYLLEDVIRLSTGVRGDNVIKL